jgi:hypothetical protein
MKRDVMVKTDAGLLAFIVHLIEHVKGESITGPEVAGRKARWLG